MLKTPMQEIQHLNAQERSLESLRETMANESVLPKLLIFVRLFEQAMMA